MKTGIQIMMLGLAALAFSACGQQTSTSVQGGNSPTEAPTETMGDAVPASPLPATATRDDVIEALRCHAVLSSAMANQIVVEANAGAVVGIGAQTRWYAEAQRRAAAAGISDADFTTLAAETRAPMNTVDQRIQNTPVLQTCLANVPAL